MSHLFMMNYCCVLVIPLLEIVLLSLFTISALSLRNRRKSFVTSVKAKVMLPYANYSALLHVG